METALVALVDDLCWELDKSAHTPVGSAAILSGFRYYLPGIFLDCLSGMGLGGTVLQWLQSFLEGKTQKVVLATPVRHPVLFCLLSY